MKRALIFLGVFVLVLLAAVNALLLMPPTGWLKPLLAEGIRETTGYELASHGRMSLRLVPNLNLTLDDVELKNPAAPGQPLLNARAIEVRSDVWPLVRGERNIERVRLVGPKVSLTVGKDGAVSWTPSAPASTRAPSDAGKAAPGELRVASLLVTGGT